MWMIGNCTNMKLRKWLGRFNPPLGFIGNQNKAWPLRLTKEGFMNIDLSKNELTLLEDALFAKILQGRTEARNATEPKKTEISKHVNDLEDLNHKIWRAKLGQ